MTTKRVHDSTYVLATISFIWASTLGLKGIEGRTNASINVQLRIYANLFWQSDNLLKPPEPIYSNYLMYSVGKPPARSYQNFLIFSKPIIFPSATADEKLSTNNQIPMKLSK